MPGLGFGFMLFGLGLLLAFGRPWRTPPGNRLITLLGGVLMMAGGVLMLTSQLHR